MYIKLEIKEKDRLFCDRCGMKIDSYSIKPAYLVVRENPRDELDEIEIVICSACHSCLEVD